jgi:hypothetical protein
MIGRIMRWCVPASAFWSWRDQLWVFYDGAWAGLDLKDKLRYMAIYGVLPPWRST